MLHTFDLHVELKQSKDYIRLLILLHLIALYLCINTSLPSVFIYGTSIYLIGSFGYLLNKRGHLKPYTELIYDGRLWKLLSKDSIIQFTEIQLKLDAGFFLYINLRNDNNKKSLVLFYDQLMEEQRHMIKILCNATASP